MSPDTTSEGINSFPQKVVLVAVIVIIAGLCVKVLGGMQTNEETTTAVVNETFNCTTLGTAATLDHNSSSETYFITLVNSTITQVTNDTNAAFSSYLRAGNFTVGLTAGTITCTSGSALSANSEYNLSYSYTIGSEARNRFGEGITSLTTLIDWMDEIALVIAAVIILGLIMGMLILVQAYRQGQGGHSL